MNKKNITETILAILFLVFSLPVNGKEIITEGYGYNRDAAVNAALRNAVEKCVGVSIGSKTLVENFSLVSDKIISHTSGYVSACRVKEEKQEFGLVKVVVKADVSMGKLESDLAAQKLLYKMVNQPRIMVLLDERIEKEPMQEKTASFKFEQVLTSKGFIVVEPEQSARIQGLDDNKQLADIAFRNGADLLIRGSVSVAKATPKTIYGSQFYSVPIQLNARIVRSDNAQIIASRTKKITKNSREETSAANFGLESGGEELAQELISDLNQFWQSEAYNESRVVIVLRGFPVKNLDSIEQKLKKISSVRDLKLRYIEGNDCIYDVDLRGSINELRVSAVKAFEQTSIAELSSHRMVLQKGTAPNETSFNPEKAEVEITAFNLKDIFPARIRYYENNPLAGINVQCEKQDVLDLKISVIIPEMMNLPAEKHLNHLSSGQTHELTLNLMLDRDKVLENSSTRTVYGQAAVSWSVNGKKYEKKLTAPVKVHERNAMDWSFEEGIGGFVTYGDPVVADLASQSVRTVNFSGNYSRGLFHGMVLFQTINHLGIKYVKDPSAHQGDARLDKVQFPSETIRRKAGDCDDLAVLYASLLSSVGIRTAIISYSDHVLVMFDTGIFRKNRYILSLDSALTVEHDGTLWIPVETTMPAEGFSKAWHTAAREFHEALAEGNRITIIDLHKAWGICPPAPVKKSEISVSIDGLQKAVDSEAGKLKKISEESLSSALKKLEQNSSGKSSAKILNSKGLLYVRQRMINEAKGSFKQASEKDKDPAFSSNYACALLLAGEETDAAKILNSIYKQDTSGRIAVNRALCYYVKAKSSSESEQFISALKEAVAMMPSSENLSRYLGVDLTGDNSSKAAEIMDAADDKEVNLRRLRELIRQRVLSSPDSDSSKVSGTTTETSTGTRNANKAPVVLPYGGIRGADPQQVSKIADLLYWFE